MKLRQSEDELQQAIRDKLHLHGWRTFRLEADNYEGRRKKRGNIEEPGTPDLIAVRKVAGTLAFRTDGLIDVQVDTTQHHSKVFSSLSDLTVAEMVFIECKSARGTLNLNQKIWIADARKRGYKVIVAKSVDDIGELL